MRMSVIALSYVLGASSLAAAQTFTLATDTHIPAVAVRAIATRSVHPGDTVYLQTTAPVTVEGRVAIPAGTYVRGTVSSAVRRGWVRPKFELRLTASTFTFANGYEADGPSLASESIVGENGVRRDDANVAPALIGSVVAGGLLAGPIVPLVGAGVFAAILVHPNQLAMDAGARVEFVLDDPLTLDAGRVADAAGRDVRMTVARRGNQCFDAGSPATPDIMIPGTPGTPAMGDVPGTPATPSTIIPGVPGIPAGWKSCP
jgi:hypothetical protein